MIYAVHKFSKRHRIVEPDAKGKYRASMDERLVQATPDGWIEWQGGECPLPDGVEYEVKHRGGEVVGREAAESFDDQWDHLDLSSDIIAYRPILDADTKPEPPAWDGEGVPSAGTQVDCKDEKTPMWTRCQVVFSSDYVVVVEAIDGFGEGAQVALDVLGKDGLGRLRPIRSEEDRAVEAMARVLDWGVDIGHLRALYRAGYRK